MAIGIFRRPYTIRRSGEQKIIDGYSVSEKTEFTAKLNIQPLSSNNLLAVPEGQRTIKRIKSFGSVEIVAADEQNETPGDLLFYNGNWFECVSCVHWSHTPLSHYEAEFVILADQSSQPPPKSKGDAANDG